MKAIIGVSSNVKEDLLSVPMSNIRAIKQFGGIPLVLPNLVGEEIEQIAETIDGLLLTGGGDIDPTLFDEEPLPGLGNIVPERDEFEMALIQKMLELGKPILGICRGAQIMSIAVGGDMYQDIYSQKGGSLLQHDQQAPNWHGSHFVEVTAGSLLHKIVGVDKFKVNSYHHQALRNMPDGFIVSGVASDGVIESFESTKHPFVMGVQWHPESLLPKGDASSLAIFEAFMNACKK
ncbi:gamma-glutamyl-gamma-aminobutyrate hydrolase family protein [Psychrobacillus sp. NPDC096623]|uniref:gamma-glutamyl-gamma-aminobutyrate hydrolase family protein n=1 Tax=Psychrobacillus sp. NPDC096623 TaxID=3364492 RepID=UPI0038002035